MVSWYRYILWMNRRVETVETVPVKYQDLTFQKLFGYYGLKGIVLNQKHLSRIWDRKQKKASLIFWRSYCRTGQFPFPASCSYFWRRNKEGQPFSSAWIWQWLFMVGNKVENKVGNKKTLNSRRQEIVSEMKDNSNITIEKRWKSGNIRIYRFMKGYIQNDKNTLHLPRQDIPGKEKSLKISPCLRFLLRFTNIFGESGLAIIIFEMKSIIGK